MVKGSEKREVVRGARNIRPTVLIIAEGRNVTETQYFRSLQKVTSGYNIKMLRAGGKTDPEKLKKVLKEYWLDNRMNAKDGDRGFVVIDLDCDKRKAELIKSLGANTPECSFIVSNPCFEIWFLLHYGYSTKAYASSDAAVKELANNIRGYRKNTNVWPLLEDKMNDAIENAERLEKHFEELARPWPSADCNPRTDAHKVVRLLTEANTAI